MDTAELIQIQSQFKELTKLIGEMHNVRIVRPEPMQSPTIEKISDALSLAQRSFKPAYKNKQGSFAEYADLESCLLAIKDGLGNNGLSISQPLTETTDGLFLYTVLRHSSGEYISSKIKVTASDNDINVWASHVVYLRRYTLSSLVGIVGSSEDDDGDMARKERDTTFSAATALKEQQRNTTGVDNNGPVLVISKDQLDELNYELKDWPDLTEEVKKRWGLRYLADMPKDRYREAKTRILQLKKERVTDKFNS